MRWQITPSKAVSANEQFFALEIDSRFCLGVPRGRRLRIFRRFSRALLFRANGSGLHGATYEAAFARPGTAHQTRGNGEAASPPLAAAWFYGARPTSATAARRLNLGHRINRQRRETTPKKQSFPSIHWPRATTPDRCETAETILSHQRRFNLEEPRSWFNRAKSALSNANDAWNRC